MTDSTDDVDWYMGPEQDYECESCANLKRELVQARANERRLREAVRKLGVAHEEVCPSKAGCATLIEARAALAGEGGET